MKSNQLVKHTLGIALPADFEAFYQLVQQLEDQGLALNEYPLNIELVGPFALFDEEPSEEEPSDLWSGRFFNDPPEFITVLRGEPDGLHWGYWFDVPGQERPVVASYYHNDAFIISEDGLDLFSALAAHLADVRRTMTEYLHEDVKHVKEYQAAIQRIDRIHEHIRSYTRQTPWQRPITAQTRDGMGIWVPPQQYRPTPIIDQLLREDGLPGKAAADTLYAEAIAALEAGFPGVALHIGRELWIYPPYYQMSYELLDRAYTDLNRAILRDWLTIARQFRA